MWLNAVNKVLHNMLTDVTAQLEVIHEDMLHGNSLQDLLWDRTGQGCVNVSLWQKKIGRFSYRNPKQYPWIEKQVDMFVEQSLILLIPCTEILQKLMSRFHDFQHSDIFILDFNELNISNDFSSTRELLMVVREVSDTNIYSLIQCVYIYHISMFIAM